MSVQMTPYGPNFGVVTGLPVGEQVVIPKEIVDAAIVVCMWFNKQNIKHWKLAGCQSRED